MQVKPVLTKKKLNLDFLGDDGKKALRSYLECIRNELEEKIRSLELENYIFSGGPKPKWLDEVLGE
jgi:hypothetical protein